MSLYYEAADVLANPDKVGGSLKSRIYKNKESKTSPAQIFALISEASKWSPVLKDVIERCGLLAEEKKLTPTLALLLTHDLLLSKSGVAAHTNHVLKLAILRHKARLTAELTKARIRRGYATLDALRQAVDAGDLEIGDEARKERYEHPRWVRINTLRTSMAEQLSTTFSGYRRVSDLEEIQRAPASAKVYLDDPHIPDVLALPPNVDLSKSEAYSNGAIIFQDKASCFPAYLLDVKPGDGDAIDGCAAPGNKTTHLAALVADTDGVHVSQKVFAFEKDKARALTLHKMVKRASAESIVTIKPGADFLAADPSSEEFANVGAILLDPSCSGSGIVGRDDAIKMHLPDGPIKRNSDTTSKKGHKRKKLQETSNDNKCVTLTMGLGDVAPEETPIEGQLSGRLSALSAFQLRILMHAMHFPRACKITYSTCSIHFEENEGVVFQALASSVAKERGWRILPREWQVHGLQVWGKRGVWDSGKLHVEVDVDRAQREEICNACIRCEKGTQDGTMGFFVAAFVRTTDATSEGMLNHSTIQDGQERRKRSRDGNEAKATGPPRGVLSEATEPPKKRSKRARIKPATE